MNIHVAPARASSRLSSAHYRREIVHHLIQARDSSADVSSRLAFQRKLDFFNGLKLEQAFGDDIVFVNPEHGRELFHGTNPRVFHALAENTFTFERQRRERIRAFKGAAASLGYRSDLVWDNDFSYFDSVLTLLKSSELGLKLFEWSDKKDTDGGLYFQTDKDKGAPEGWGLAMLEKNYVMMVHPREGKDHSFMRKVNLAALMAEEISHLLQGDIAAEYYDKEKHTALGTGLVSLLVLELFAQSMRKIVRFEILTDERGNDRHNVPLPGTWRDVILKTISENRSYDRDKIFVEVLKDMCRNQCDRILGETYNWRCIDYRLLEAMKDGRWPQEVQKHALLSPKSLEKLFYWPTGERIKVSAEDIREISELAKQYLAQVSPARAFEPIQQAAERNPYRNLQRYLI